VEFKLNSTSHIQLVRWDLYLFICFNLYL